MVSSSGKRANSRLHVFLQAKVTTRAATLAGVLEDLSRTGARVAFDPVWTRAGSELPALGTEALIEWADFEAFGPVVWVDGPRLAVNFYEPLTEAVLLATRRLSDATALSSREAVRDTAQQWVLGTSRIGL